MKFQPGQSGNPGGRPKVDEDLKEARAHAKDSCDRAIARISQMTSEELKELLVDPCATVTELILARIAATAIQHGDPKRGAFLIERIAGKVPNFIAVQSEVPLEVTHASVLKLIESYESKKEGDE